MLVDISSSNGEFMASLGSYSLTSSFDLCDAGAASNSLRIMGYPVNDEVKGKELVSFDLKPQMKLLKEFVGTHNFKATVKDAKGGIARRRSPSSYRVRRSVLSSHGQVTTSTDATLSWTA